MAPVLRLAGVTLQRDGRTILDRCTWQVDVGQRWALVGPNGCGKTTLLRIAALYLHPSSGSVEVLGGELGRIDVRTHRRRIGFVSAAMADLFRPSITARDVVMTARHGALEPWWHEYTDHDRDRADIELARAGCAGLGSRTFGTLSSGERQRVLLARLLFPDPELLLLDEPAAGLDLAGREELVATLGRLAADPGTPPLVLVTHHVEEIPTGTTHALLMRDGAVVAAGPIRDTLTGPALSDVFGLDVDLRFRDGRWSARAG